jgi:hypothetical protein
VRLVFNELDIYMGLTAKLYMTFVFIIGGTSKSASITRSQTSVIETISVFQRRSIVNWKANRMREMKRVCT